MSKLRPRKSRLRLDAEAYHHLRQQILERDAWRCQICGNRRPLEVHHIEARSRQGGDEEENLMTLCAACHRVLHERNVCGPKKKG